MTITTEQLQTWCEQLCTLPPVDFAGALQALGIAGSLVAKSPSNAVVNPPPPGASRLGLTMETLGMNQGKLRSLEFTLAAGVVLTRGALEQQFGASDSLPRVDYDRSHVLGYVVEVDGAPFRCSIFASFADVPAPASAATKVMLRRDAST
jgi:hypothetical protein